MPRAKTGVARHKKVKKVLKAVKGYYGGRHRLYRTAKQAVTAAGVDAYRGRKQKKRDFRALWITRISAAAKIGGISYSRLMNGFKKAKVEMNRKVLADLAVKDEKAFGELVTLAQDSLK